MFERKWRVSIYKILNQIFNPYMNGGFLLKRISKLSTLFIFNKTSKKEKYSEIYDIVKTKLYGYKVLRTAREIGEGFYCGGWSSCTKNTILKEHVSFNGMDIRGKGQCKIGRYFHSGRECMILTSNHKYDEGNKIPYDDTENTIKDVEIGDFVWFGSRVMILPGTKIGEGAIIQGGSVVHGEIPPYAIAGGNPAKVFKYRDIEHFKKLKKEGKFH